MSRKLWPLFVCAACFVSQAAHAWTLSGSIGLATNASNSSVRSSAVIWVFLDNGAIDWTAQISGGYHSIYESGFGSAILAGHSIFGTGTVSSFVSGTGVVTLCYDARIVAAVRGLFFDEIAGPRCLLPPPPPGGGGGCKASTNWNTVVLDLSTGRELRLDGPIDKSGGSPLLSAEVRSDESGEKTYILDQWAVVDSARRVVRTSTTKAEVGWLDDLAGVPAKSPLLVIQSPIHSTPMPAPLVRFDARAANAYLRSIRTPPAPSKIAVRLEFTPGGVLLNKEVLRGDQQLGLHFADSVSLQALSGHSHRTIVFAVFEVTRRGVRLANAKPVLAKCCCGDWNPYCI